MLFQKCLLNKEPHEEGTVMMNDKTEAELTCDRASFRIQVCLTPEPNMTDLD